MKSLSPQKQLFLLFHLSIGNFFLYPQLLLKLANVLQFKNGTSLQFFYGLVMILSSILIAFPGLKIEWQHFSQKLSQRPKEILHSFLLILLSSITLNGLISFIVGPVEASNQKLLLEQYQSTPYLIMFMALIYAPIVEEILFRGLLLSLFKSLKMYQALWLSSLLFGLSHMFAQGFMLSDLIFLPTYTLLGYLLAKRYVDSNSLFSAIFVHFLNNLIGVIAFMSL